MTTKTVTTPCAAPELEKALLSVSHDGGWDNATVKASEGKIEIIYEEHKADHEKP